MCHCDVMVPSRAGRVLQGPPEKRRTLLRALVLRHVMAMSALAPALPDWLSLTGPHVGPRCSASTQPVSVRPRRASSQRSAPAPGTRVNPRPPAPGSTTGPRVNHRPPGQPPAPGPRVNHRPPAPGSTTGPRYTGQPPAPGTRVNHRPPVHGSTTGPRYTGQPPAPGSTTGTRVNHRPPGQPPVHGSTTGTRVNHRPPVHGSTTGPRYTGQPPAPGTRVNHRLKGQPPAHGSTTGSRYTGQPLAPGTRVTGSRYTGQPPAHGSTTGSRVNHRLTGQPPAHGTRVTGSRDPCTKVQDSELKIAASARFLGTTTRQLELLAAPTAHALPNGLTRAGTLSAPPGQGEHSARSLRVPLFVEFLQEPYCTACFLGRPPTHSGRHSQSLELALPSVPRIQPSGLEANHMLALLLASEPRAHSSSSSTSLRPDPCSIRE
ncbi:unnamed protein product [Gadus morhua 'NCC']